MGYCFSRERFWSPAHVCLYKLVSICDVKTKGKIYQSCLSAYLTSASKSPSYSTHVHLTCEEISKTCIVYETCLCICNREAVLDYAILHNREAVFNYNCINAMLHNREAVLNYAILHNPVSHICPAWMMQSVAISWVMFVGTLYKPWTWICWRRRRRRTRTNLKGPPPSGRGLTNLNR